jgi:hypothetical protein
MAWNGKRGGTVDGLIIKKKWLDLILNDHKIWEIRSSDTKKRGRIGLIESKSGQIKGACDLVDSFPFTKDLQDELNNYHKHWLTEHQLYYMQYKRPHVWVLSNVKMFDEPVDYRHPQGAVIWVKDITKRIFKKNKQKR